ncbi:MAG: response regulator, partial [Nitrosomonas sp.]|nr:response regulator [Nitrosomonas sp.]
MSATVLVVEDEPAIQELISYNLRNAGYVSLSAETAEQAIAMVNEVLPDLILVDWMLPSMSGIDFVRLLRSGTRTKPIPIIMLTARVDETDKISGLEVGADDYITKPFSPRELNARIKAVLRRRIPEISDEVIDISGLRLDPTTHRVTISDMPEGIYPQEIILGPTEFRLLHYLMAHSERVHSRAQLLDRVWG